MGNSFTCRRIVISYKKKNIIILILSLTSATYYYVHYAEKRKGRKNIPKYINSICLYYISIIIQTWLHFGIKKEKEYKVLAVPTRKLQITSLECLIEAAGLSIFIFFFPKHSVHK